VGNTWSRLGAAILTKMIKKVSLKRLHLDRFEEKQPVIKGTKLQVQGETQGGSMPSESEEHSRGIGWRLLKGTNKEDQREFVEDRLYLVLQAQ
jgi:hypothetical protein